MDRGARGVSRDHGDGLFSVGALLGQCDVSVMAQRDDTVGVRRVWQLRIRACGAGNIVFSRGWACALKVYSWKFKVKS